MKPFVLLPFLFLSVCYSHNVLLQRHVAELPAGVSVTLDQVGHDMNATVIPLPRVWQILGPFPLGMREEGADPLAPYGHEGHEGHEDQLYPSELVDHGFVGWTYFDNSNGSPDTTVGPIQFDTGVRWGFNRDFYGWTINQWQGWAVSTLAVPEDALYLATCSNIGEFFVDEVRFRGDWYQYGNGWQAVRLTRGDHKIKVRLGSSIRIFGGGLPPQVTFICRFQRPSSQTALTWLPDDSMVPDVVSGVLAGDYMSLTFVNGLGRWASITAAASVPGTPFSVRTLTDERYYFAPGQVRVLPLKVTQVATPTTCPVVIPINITLDGTTSEISVSFPCKDWGTAYSFTFLDFDNSVHYGTRSFPSVHFPLCLPLIT